MSLHAIVDTEKLSLFHMSLEEDEDDIDSLQF